MSIISPIRRAVASLARTWAEPLSGEALPAQTGRPGNIAAHNHHNTTPDGDDLPGACLHCIDLGGNTALLDRDGYLWCVLRRCFIAPQACPQRPGG